MLYTMIILTEFAHPSQTLQHYWLQPLLLDTPCDLGDASLPYSGNPSMPKIMLQTSIQCTLMLPLVVQNTKGNGYQKRKALPNSSMHMQYTPSPMHVLALCDDRVSSSL